MSKTIITSGTTGHESDGPKIAAWLRRVYKVSATTLAIKWIGDYRAEISGVAMAKNGRTGRIIAQYCLQHGGIYRDRCEVQWID
jgi:hypothetical protein